MAMCSSSAALVSTNTDAIDLDDAIAIVESSAVISLISGPEDPANWDR